MKSLLRNRLAEILLSFFNDPERRSAVEFLYVFCEMASRRDPPEVSLGELLRERGAVSSHTAEVAVVIEQMRWDPRAITAAQVLSLREFRGVVEEEVKSAT